MFGHPGECRVIVNILNEPLRTRCAPREGAGRPLVDGGEIPEHPPRPRETRNGGGVCGAILVLCAMSSPPHTARHAFSNFAPRCFCCVLQCPWNVVERDLSFRTRILSPSNSSGVARTSPRTVFAQFGGRRRVSAVRFGGIFGSFLGL